MKSKYIELKKIELVWIKCMLILPLMIGISSCNKYLDVAPSKSSSVVVSKTEDLEAILNNYSEFSQEPSFTRLYGTDDFEMSTALYDRAASTYTLQNYQFGFWDRQYTPQTAEPGWSGEFKKIFYANLVLTSLDKVTGTEEAKSRLKAEAHFVRAYSYWILANTFCLPYTEATRNELGLPIKLSTSFEEDLVRAPLYKVYELIESDLQEALKTNLPLIQSGVVRNWRANVAAVNTFAARYYLHRGNYTEAEKYASISLNAYSDLVDYNTEVKVGLTYPVMVNGLPATIDLPNTVFGSSFSSGIPWREFTYFRTQTINIFCTTSPNLDSQYDHEHDLRYKWHHVQGLLYLFAPATANPALVQPSYAFFEFNKLPSGPTVAEAILIKAEALARLSRIQEAMTTINILRAKRMTPGNWVNLVAGSQREAIDKILQERRREVPFSQRWYDLRRLNNNDDPLDDKVVVKQFYEFDNTRVYSDKPKTYTLEKNSRRYAAPIPQTDITASNNVIQQNIY